MELITYHPRISSLRKIYDPQTYGWQLELPSRYFLCLEAMFFFGFLWKETFAWSDSAGEAGWDGAQVETLEQKVCPGWKYIWSSMPRQWVI